MPGPAKRKQVRPGKLLGIGLIFVEKRTERPRRNRRDSELPQDRNRPPELG